MKLKQIGSNMTQLELGYVQVFFSYETPVAARTDTGALLRTSTKYSVTTTKHINKWLEGMPAVEVPQSVINDLVEVA
tara:strand:- start:395 stop:625 length:231 start_codon:yes stop_codon:yes gene_type:complete